MTEIIVAVVVVILSVAIIFAYLASGTRLDRIVRKKKKQEKNQPKKETAKETKQETETEKKEEAVKEDKKADVKKENTEKQKVDIQQIKKEMYDKAVEDVTPTIKKEVEEEYIKKFENENKKQKSVGEQIQDLSPEMKAILFTDIIKPKF